MMDQVSDLLGIIREEINLYRDLIEHARRKTSLLVQGGVEAILESNRIEDAIHSRLRTMELEMRRLHLNLCQAFGIQREEITLMKLADHLEPSFALELREQTALFRNLVQQLKSVSRRNMRLIANSMYYSRGLLAVLSNASGSYRQSGLFEQIPSIQPTFSQRA